MRDNQLFGLDIAFNSDSQISWTHPWSGPNPRVARGLLHHEARTKPRTHRNLPAHPFGRQDTRTNNRRLTNFYRGQFDSGSQRATSWKWLRRESHDSVDAPNWSRLPPCF